MSTKFDLKKMVIINKDECIGCGYCIAVCPVEAISIMNKLAQIDSEKCTECGTCIDECPIRAIKYE